MKGTVKLKDSCFESKISLDPEETGNCSPGVRYNNRAGFAVGMQTAGLETDLVFSVASLFAYATFKLLFLLLEEQSLLRTPFFWAGMAIL